MTVFSRPGKTRTHAIGLGAETQIEARGLNLRVLDFLRSLHELAIGDRRLDALARQQTEFSSEVGERRRFEERAGMGRFQGP
jgi:hypothetical protein